MQSIVTKKYWLKPKNQTNCRVPSRNIEPICGPPRFPMSLGQKVLIGGGSMLLMLVIPIWGLISVPTWAIKHANLGKANMPPTDEEGEALPEEGK